jgi:hypothetical protein
MLKSRRQRHIHGPDWRWKLAQAWAGSAATGPINRTDQQVCAAFDYLRKQAGAPGQQRRARQQFPHIATAELLAQNSEVCGELKVLVLGGCSPPEICERLSLDPKVLATWESLFFDVRGSQEATDWVLANVIQPEQERGDGHLAAKLKCACAGGPVAAVAVLDAESRVSLKAGATLFDKKIILHLKFDQAAKLKIETNSEKLFFLKMHVKLMGQEKQLRQAEKRLEQKSQEALEKHSLAQQRLELQRQRQEERAAQAAERKEARARKEEERRVQVVQKQVERTARAAAGVRRRQAAKVRAAQSPLAQLRWEHSEVSFAAHEEYLNSAEQATMAATPRIAVEYTNESGELDWYEPEETMENQATDACVPAVAERCAV